MGLCMTDGIIMLRVFKIKVKKMKVVNIRNRNLSLKSLQKYSILMTQEYLLIQDSNDSTDLQKGENRVGINRLFLGPFNTKVFGEKIKKKHDNKVFDEILQEEHAKLMQVVSKMEKKWNTKNLCRKYNLKEEYHLPSNE